MKKAILLLSLFAVSSCAGTPLVPSSIEEPSSTPEATSDTSKESEASSEESIEPKPEDKIYLYDKESRLYAVNDIERDAPYLKTYRHKDKEDVPYVDIDEFQHARKHIDPDMKPHNLVKLDDGAYDLYSPFGGHCYLFPAEQKIVLHETEAFYGEFTPTNNGIYLDPGMQYPGNQGSPKTKYLVKNGDVTYDLAKYEMSLVEQDGHIYLPFGLASHLLVNPMGYALAYNGRDFYNSTLLMAETNRIRPFSNETGFCWSYANDTKNRAHFEKKTPKEGESYRFEGTIIGFKGDNVPASAIFKNDGTLTFKSEDLMGTVDFSGTWKEAHHVIEAHLVPEGLSGSEQTQYIDLREGSSYRKETRTPSMIQYMYNQLCMDFDYQYGVTELLGITSFDAELTRLNLKSALLDPSYATYYDALTRFVYGGKMGDGHTTLLHEGVASHNLSRSLGAAYGDIAGERVNAFATGMAAAGEAKAKLPHFAYNEQGKTAVISLPHFTADYKAKFLGVQSYVVPEGTEDIDKFINAEMNKDVVKGVCYAMNQVKKNANIENVVFDVGLNRGGYAMLIPFLSAFMTDDPSMIYQHSISGSVIDAHYKVDLNGNGKFGEPEDTWKGQYHYYVLQGSGSFSAGNIFPCAAKNGGYAVTIGEKTLGGGCGVARRADLSGYHYQYNGNIGFPEKKADGSFVNSECGVEPNIAMPLTDAYDLEKLDAKLQSLSAA